MIPSSLFYFLAREKNIYKMGLAFLFLGLGKIRLQNEPRSLVSWLGKNSFTKRIFSAILLRSKGF